MIPDFEPFVEELAFVADAAGAAASAPGFVSRYWALPPVLDGSLNVDLQLPQTLIDAYDRDAMNEYCVEAYQAGDEPNSDVGRRGVVMAAKTAIAYVGAMERAAHARYASPVRLRVWAGARRQGHGDDQSGVFGAVLNAVGATEAAATAFPNEPEV